MTALVAIVGRPNVGKSTLFNRLTGKRLALVDDRPGVTRDRREGDARLGGLRFRIVDTAGLEDSGDDTLAGRMRLQSEKAIADSDVCLFMTDARSGLTPMDKHFAGLLRKSGKPVIVLANKAEGEATESGVLEAFSLGLGEPIALSAAHGSGLDELHDALEPYVEDGGKQALEDKQDQALRLAIVGRPNAGKSTLVNRLVGSDRVLTGPEAGITRDAIAVDWAWKGRVIRLWDTAGMRRKARISDKLEKLSVSDGLRAVDFAEVVVLLLDATQALEKQDLTIADKVAREGRALVIAINKWDLVRDKQAARKEIELEVELLLPQLSGVPLVFMSAETGTGVNQLMPAVMKIYDIWNRRVSTSKLNDWLHFQIEKHPPPAPSGRRLKLRYMTQARTRPPTFALFSSSPDKLPDSYTRYLINGLRQDFGLQGVPIRIHVRKGNNPYAG